MIKLIYCITKKPGMTDEAFFDYWQNVHGPIATNIPGLRRLVQSHVLALPPGLRNDFDGVAELWFDDLAALQRARQSPGWAASSADEANFIDPSKVAILITQEQDIPLE